ncbi:MAG: glycosyltransferase family 2 protein [Terriglobales bacterium]
MIVSIIIPVYNEFRTLPQVLERVQAAPLPPGCDREILIVDDGSTDGTQAVLQAASRTGVITASTGGAAPRGKGAAIRTGIVHAHGEIILIQDGDLEYDPSDYLQLLAPLVNGKAAVVYGSRFLSGLRRRELGMTRSAWLANRVLVTAANLLYRARLTDEATAYKAFRTDLLRSLDLRCEGFEFCPEVTAKLRRRGVPIHEVPTRYNARRRADGKKVTARDGWAALKTLWRYRNW